ncbi:MAG: ankyrin repeat domain-containing protein [Gammaproteobacteria bacterium]
MVQHKKVLEKIIGRLQQRQEMTNAQVYVQDLVAIQVNDKNPTDYPWGEFDPNAVTPPQEHKETESEREVVQRMMLHLVDLAKFAATVHRQENFITPAPDSAHPQTPIMDPKKLNHMTRLTLNEFSLYPNKNRGPLTIKGFKLLLKALERMAADLPENLQLVISSIPVKTFIEEQDEKQEIQRIAVLRNMSITIDCGKRPHVRPFAKSFPPPNDPTYTGIQNCYAINTSKLTEKLKLTWESLQKKLIVDCKSATVDDVKAIVDIFAPLNFECYAKDQLVKRLETIKTLIQNNELDSMPEEQRQNLASQIEDTILNIRGAIGYYRTNIPLSAPILGGKGDEEHDFIFGGDSISETAGKRRFHMAVDLCYDTHLKVAERMIGAKINLARQKTAPPLPLQSAHVISSNFLKTRPREFLSRTVTYADSKIPDVQTDRIRYKSRKQYHISQPKFGSHTVIDIYPSRKLSYFNGELATSVKEHNKFMLKLEALRLYQLNQPTEFFQLEHLIQEHMLVPVIQHLDKWSHLKLAPLANFSQRLQAFINTAPLGADYPIDLLRELQAELKNHPSITMVPIQRAIDQMEIERENSQKLRQQFPYLDLTLSTTKPIEMKDHKETAIIPYRSVNAESQIMLFMHAAKNNDLALMKKLVAQGQINLDYQDASGRTALHYATYFEKTEIVKFLLSMGANPKILDGNGENVLHISARGAFGLSTEILKLRSDMDVNATNREGDTPALIAVKLGKEYGMGARVASYLSSIMEYKLDLNKVDASKQTVLDYASLHEDWDLIVKMMLSVTNCKFPYVAVDEILKSFLSQLKKVPSEKLSDIFQDTLTERNALGKLLLQDKEATRKLSMEFLNYIATATLVDTDKLNLLGKIKQEEKALAKMLSANPAFSSELAACEAAILKPPSL